MPKKELDLKGLKAKLDRVFSKYIRMRDSDEDGIVKCITCGKWVAYIDADAGHFISRKNLSTRYMEQNCHAQCRHDNRFLHGLQYEIIQHIITRNKNQYRPKNYFTCHACCLVNSLHVLCHHPK